jgi:hypothetical protein
MSNYKYYIWENNKPRQVSIEEYENWYKPEGEKFSLPVIQTKLFKLWTEYNGNVANDSNESFKPFMVFCENHNDDTDILCEPFATFEEAMKRYDDFRKEENIYQLEMLKTIKYAFYQ